MSMLEHFSAFIYSKTEYLALKVLNFEKFKPKTLKNTKIKLCVHFQKTRNLIHNIFLENQI